MRSTLGLTRAMAFEGFGDSMPEHVGGLPPIAAAPQAAGAPPQSSMAPPAGLGLEQALASLGVDKALTDALIEAVGGHSSTSVSDVVSIPETDLGSALNALSVDGALATPVIKGRAVRALRLLYEAADVVAPSFGAPLPAQSLAPGLTTEAKPTTDDPAGSKRKFADVLEQGMPGEFYLLPDGDIRWARAAYINITGSEPPEHARPTKEQLSAVASLLRSESAPYCDFAVFGPYGRRQAKARRFEAQTFVDGRLQTRMISGPSNFEAWRAIWLTFRTCLISLEAVPPGVLDSYEEGVRQLSPLHPAHWGVIVRADDTVRAERWEVLLENLSQRPSRADQGGLAARDRNFDVRCNVGDVEPLVVASHHRPLPALSWRRLGRGGGGATRGGAGGPSPRSRTALTRGSRKGESQAPEPRQEPTAEAEEDHQGSLPRDLQLVERLQYGVRDDVHLGSEAFLPGVLGRPPGLRAQDRLEGPCGPSAQGPRR